MIDKITMTRCSFFSEFDRLEMLRLKEATAHKEAMRILVKLLSTRGDIIRNANERANNWQTIAEKLGRKNRILESCVRVDRRANSVFRLGLNRES